MPAPPAESLQEGFLRGSDARLLLQQHELASDAQQLGKAPAFLSALGSAKCLIDCRNSLLGAAGTAQGFCQAPEKHRIANADRALRNVLDRGMQKRDRHLGITT